MCALLTCCLSLDRVRACGWQCVRFSVRFLSGYCLVISWMILLVQAEIVFWTHCRSTSMMPTHMSEHVCYRSMHVLSTARYVGCFSPFLFNRKQRVLFLGAVRYNPLPSFQALPLCRYTEVMELTVGRLGDKSVHVCKSAIQLLAAFIAHNPYSCKVQTCSKHLIDALPLKNINFYWPQTFEH